MSRWKFFLMFLGLIPLAKTQQKRNFYNGECPCCGLKADIPITKGTKLTLIGCGYCRTAFSVAPVNTL